MSITAIRALVDAQPVSNKLAYDIKAILNKMDALPDTRVPVADKTTRIGRRTAKVANSPEEAAKLEEKRRKDRERKAAKKAKIAKSDDI